MADSAATTASTAASTTAPLLREAEARFGHDELFYSRTDPRGVILAGNDVFRRVSGFEWGKLLGAPHRIVRHPDTPKGVFRILWDALGGGHPMGAYVLNRAANGDYYWVFAVVMPMAEGGFLSVRMKPLTPQADQVRAAYTRISAVERAGKSDPEDSANALRAFAQELGFSSYTSFMANALGQELAARDTRLGRPADPRAERLAAMNAALEQVTDEQRKMLRGFEALRLIPANMRLVAARLEPQGGPVSTISESYREASMTVAEKLRSVAAGRENLCDRVSRQVARALFLFGSARLLAEMNANFATNTPVEGIDWETERAHLRALEQSTRTATLNAMQEALRHAEDLNRASAEVRRLMLGLDTIRVLGRVECGRMPDGGGALSTTIDQLDVFHAEVKDRLEAIMRLSGVIGGSMEQFLNGGDAPPPSQTRSATPPSTLLHPEQAA